MDELRPKLVQIVWFSLYKILENTTYFIVIESRSVLARGWGRFRERQERKITKRQEKTFGGDGYVYYFDCGDGFTAVYICQNLSNYIL